MKDKKVTVMEKVRPDLLLPPHIAGKLVDLVVDGWRPDLAQQDGLVHSGATGRSREVDFKTE